MVRERKSKDIVATPIGEERVIEEHFSARLRIGDAMKWLASLQNADGGFPAESVDLCSACWVTSDILLLNRCFRNRLLSTEQTALALAFLLSNQSLDGGWPEISRRVSVLEITSHVLSTLSKYNIRPQPDEQLRSAIRFVLSEQNTDGGWGHRRGKPSSPYSTFLAVHALLSTAKLRKGILVDEAELALGSGAHHLLTTQGSLGGWSRSRYERQNDASSTSYALAALRILDHYSNMFPFGDTSMISSWNTAMLNGEDWLRKNVNRGHWDVTSRSDEVLGSGLMTTNFSNILHGASSFLFYLALRGEIAEWDAEIAATLRFLSSCQTEGAWRKEWKRERCTWLTAETATSLLGLADMLCKEEPVIRQFDPPYSVSPVYRLGSGTGHSFRDTTAAQKLGNPPIVFVSYSHDNDEHMGWVLNLAIRLRENGVDVRLDQWDLRPGADLTQFMEDGLTRSQRVIVVCTDNYIDKADRCSGGVGYEKMIITADLIRDLSTKKFLPVIRGVSGVQKAPICLGNRLYVDFSDDSLFENKLIELLKEIHHVPGLNKPEIGPNPFSQGTVGMRKPRRA